MDKTFLMIKPSAFSACHVGEIIAAAEDAGFRVTGLTAKRFTPEEASKFYDVHEGKEFYGPLIEYVTSGMTVGVMLEADDAVAALRRTVGATDPADAAEGTIRARFGESLQRNAVHASDSPGRVEYESGIYFGDCERARE